MIRKDLIIVGAGPAGLSAGIEAAQRGLDVLVFDENDRPGGQLFKQIHKFFGSKEHRAKTRGYKIGSDLLKEAQAAGVGVCLQATVTGIFQDKEVTVNIGEKTEHYKADAIIVATGASENMVPFEGWTLPGVIGAGAAQTMMNIHGLKPGKKILMLGSGNVGLVVGFQLLQAGCELLAVVDAAPRIGGYGVHASKLARCGVPFYLSHTIQGTRGNEAIEGVTIAQIDAAWQPLPGTEKSFDVDTICLAVGLSPMTRLLKMAGCEMKETPMGALPVMGEHTNTSIPGIFAAGDVSGIEEASSAMIEGRIAGLAAAEYLGYLDRELMNSELLSFESALLSLREGMFAPSLRGSKVEYTDEGIPVSTNLLEKGYLIWEDLQRFPGVSNGQKCLRPVIECTQNIPCNPCQDACRKGCINIGRKISSLPIVQSENPCIGCGLCVAACSGQAIFLVDESREEGYARITLPYEFTPVPEAGSLGRALDRSGKDIGEAEVVEVKSIGTFDHTRLLTMRVKVELANEARFFRQQE